jgi:RHS repeat-associated protein
LSKTRVWGSDEKILLHFRAVGQLSEKQHWGCEEASAKNAVGSGVTYDYDAFGNLIHSTGTTPNNYLFAGEQFDPDLNLYYNRARYLSTSTGRFWSMDTFEGRSQDPRSLHKYLYAAGDPVGRRDPSGRDFIDTLGAITVQAVLTAQAVLPYAVTVTFVAGVVYVSTGVAISVDESFFGGGHTESLYTLRDGAGYVFFIAYFVTDAAQSLALVGPGARKPAQAGVSKTIQVPKSLYPESAQHIEDAQAAGQPLILTIDRSNAAQRRAEALQGFATAPGLDRDEYPPAVFAEGGSGASVRRIPIPDNRGSGAFFGNQLKGLPDGAKVKMEAVDDVPK